LSQDFDIDFFPVFNGYVLPNQSLKGVSSCNNEYQVDISAGNGKVNIDFK